MMNNSLIHWGIPGMKWGQRRTRSRGGKKSSPQKQSHFSRSLQQKYGHKSVSSLVSSVKPVAITTAKTFVKAYVAFKVTEIAVSAIPSIAWATGTVISNSPVN
jgi:hypothetical protein